MIPPFHFNKKSNVSGKEDLAQSPFSMSLSDMDQYAICFSRSSADFIFSPELR